MVPISFVKRHMIEIFKTNVPDSHQAKLLLDGIHHAFPGYKANFDLEDCDRILRIQSTAEIVDTCLLIAFLKERGVCAEVLPDVVNSAVLLAFK